MAGTGRAHARPWHVHMCGPGKSGCVCRSLACAGGHCGVWVVSPALPKQRCLWPWGAGTGPGEPCPVGAGRVGLGGWASPSPGKQGELSTQISVGTWPSGLSVVLALPARGVRAGPAGRGRGACDPASRSRHHHGTLHTRAWVCACAGMSWHPVGRQCGFCVPCPVSSPVWLSLSERRVCAMSPCVLTRVCEVVSSCGCGGAEHTSTWGCPTLLGRRCLCVSGRVRCVRAGHGTGASCLCVAACRRATRPVCDP